MDKEKKTESNRGYKMGSMKFNIDIPNFGIPVKILEDFNKRIQEVAKQTDELLKETFKGVTLTFKKIDEKVAEFSEAGWPMPEFLTPIELLEIYESSTLGNIDEKMVAVFDQGTPEFRNMKKEILSSKELEEWKPLIEECFYCYNNQKFHITIPALLSVLEGIIAKKWNKIHGKINVQNWINGKLASNDLTFELMYLKSISKFLIHLFKSIDFKNRDYPQLNRHLVLHGRSIKVWDKSDSLKLLLNIYVIATIVDQKYA
jgi:hypothetical protein